jgi:hypothetical protein
MALTGPAKRTAAGVCGWQVWTLPSAARVYVVAVVGRRLAAGASRAADLGA